MTNDWMNDSLEMAKSKETEVGGINHQRGRVGEAILSVFLRPKRVSLNGLHK